MATRTPKATEANVPGCSASPDAVEQAGSASKAYLGSAMPEQRRTQHRPTACGFEHNQARDVTHVSVLKFCLARMTTCGDDWHASPLGCDRETHVEIHVCANNGKYMQVLNAHQKAVWTKTCSHTLNKYSWTLNRTLRAPHQVCMRTHCRERCRRPGTPGCGHADPSFKSKAKAQKKSLPASLPVHLA